ncbi:dihydroneopterin aldolase [Cohaesibacter celericrescens]|uniref:7,8-dihydroneopterin aldolase n=1 Tax=Cohaesibacter celericrescens TaxID=2067669 RepID=A0A2N5XVM3_9HYPH|nr:dihydroneopterin aldolase [Cohaesibacter celericrescens]PLW78539.1 dihydroneopterin aldolase [Cohaesibacter celericrescens]
MDRIILRDLAFFAYHGVYQEEASLGQRFYFDLDCYTDLRPAGISDDENDTVRYDHIAKRVENIVLNKRFNLIEALAEAVAKDLLTNMDKLQKVRVRVRKPAAPIAAIVKDIAVEIKRTRKDYIK